jgi:hypothetical protein
VCGIVQIRGCVYVTAACLEDLGVLCPSLQELDLGGLRAATDSALSALASQLWLEALDVAECPNVTRGACRDVEPRTIVVVTAL